LQIEENIRGKLKQKAYRIDQSVRKRRKTEAGKLGSLKEFGMRKAEKGKPGIPPSWGVPAFFVFRYILKA
jgi:hypothetical protein